MRNATQCDAFNQNPIRDPPPPPSPPTFSPFTPSLPNPPLDPPIRSRPAPHPHRPKWNNIQLPRCRRVPGAYIEPPRLRLGPVRRGAYVLAPRLERVWCIIANDAVSGRGADGGGGGGEGGAIARVGFQGVDMRVGFGGGGGGGDEGFAAEIWGFFVVEAFRAARGWFRGGGEGEGGEARADRVRDVVGEEGAHYGEADACWRGGLVGFWVIFGGGDGGFTYTDVAFYYHPDSGGDDCP